MYLQSQSWYSYFTRIVTWVTPGAKIVKTFWPGRISDCRSVVSLFPYLFEYFYFRSFDSFFRIKSPSVMKWDFFSFGELKIYKKNSEFLFFNVHRTCRDRLWIQGSASGGPVISMRGATWAKLLAPLWGTNFFTPRPSEIWLFQALKDS